MAEAFETRTSKNLTNRLRTSKRIGNSSRKQNLKKLQTSNASEPARQHRYEPLQIQPYWDFNNVCFESPWARFVPIRFASYTYVSVLASLLLHACSAGCLNLPSFLEITVDSEQMELTLTEAWVGDAYFLSGIDRFCRGAPKLSRVPDRPSMFNSCKSPFFQGNGCNIWLGGIQPDAFEVWPLVAKPKQYAVALAGGPCLPSAKRTDSSCWCLEWLRGRPPQKALDWFACAFFSVQRLLIPPGWRLDRTEEIIPGRAVLAIMQDRYSTIGLISTYLHPCSKGTELRELITWLKQKWPSTIYQRWLQSSW